MEHLTVEDKIMGRKEPLPKTELELKAFTSETKYKVVAIGNDNHSIVDGVFVGSLLTYEDKKKITSGDLVVEANGLEITRLEEVETIEEEAPKPKTRKRTK